MNKLFKLITTIAITLSLTTTSVIAASQNTTLQIKSKNGFDASETLNNMKLLCRKMNANAYTELIGVKDKTSGLNTAELVDDYKSLCKRLDHGTYKDSALKDLEGNRYLVVGQVYSVSKMNDHVTIGVLITQATSRITGQKQYTGLAYISITYDLFSDEINKGDLIAAWGVIQGTVSFRNSESTTPAYSTHPLVRVKYYEMIDEFIPDPSCMFTYPASPGSETPPTTSQTTSKKVYGPNEKWIVPGKWELTINSIKTHSKCNSRSDDNDLAQCVIVTYSYKNLGVTNKFQDLFISAMNFTLYDEKDEVARLYPCTHLNLSQDIAIGKTCSDAQEAYILKNKSKNVTLEFSRFIDGKRETATFEIPVT